LAIITLGALDFSPVFPGSTPVEALWHTLELAPKLEAWGYSRYWIGEHHTQGVAHSSPDLIVSILGGLTARIRVGVAGVLLTLHSPLRVAKNFRLLHAVYPDRIDLGIARGKVDREVQILLRDGNLAEARFEDKVVELLGYLRGVSRAIVNPEGVRPPELWMLGSNIISMQIAAFHGTAFCLAEFLSPKSASAAAILSAYIKEFQGYGQIQAPKCSIAVAGICARSDNEALALMPAIHPISVLRTIVGGPLTWRKELLSRHAETGVNEFIILDLCKSIQDKLNSYRLLAEIFA